MPVELVESVAASDDYGQDLFRVSPGTEGGWIVSLVLQQPPRYPDDRKAASQRQRETLKSFFWDTDILPPNCGWQQASRLMDMRGLAYAVSETMDDGFLAANRIAVAPLIAAYISRSPYLLATARGWTLGTWRDSSTRNQSDWLMLISSPFFRELLEFAFLARTDLYDAMNRQADVK